MDKALRDLATLDVTIAYSAADGVVGVAITVALLLGAWSMSRRVTRIASSD